VDDADRSYLLTIAEILRDREVRTAVARAAYDRLAAQLGKFALDGEWAAPPLGTAEAEGQSSPRL